MRAGATRREGRPGSGARATRGARTGGARREGRQKPQRDDVLEDHEVQQDLVVLVEMRWRHWQHLGVRRSKWSWRANRRKNAVL